MAGRATPSEAIDHPPRRLLAITLLFLFVGAGNLVPLPGLSPSILEMANPLDPETAFMFSRLSVFGLGIQAWLSVAMLGEIVMLASKRARKTRFALNGHINPFDPVLMSIALLVAAVQAYGVQTAMGGMDVLSQQPGAGPLVAACLTLGVALQMATAWLVRRFSKIDSFLAITALPIAMSASFLVWDILQAINAGSMAPADGIILFICFAAVVGVLVAIFLAQARGGQSNPWALIWPILIGLGGVNFLVATAQAIPVPGLPRIVNSPAWTFSLQFLAVTGLALIYLRRHAPLAPSVRVAFALGLCTIVPDVLIGNFSQNSTLPHADIALCTLAFIGLLYPERAQGRAIGYGDLPSPPPQ